MIKIELSGTGEEVRVELLRILGLQEPKISTETLVKEERDKVVKVETSPGKTRRIRRGGKPAGLQPEIWTEEEAERLLSEIRTNAKRIMAELANQPEGYRRSELIEVLGLTEQSMRGQLSSVGSALKRMGGKPSPISKGKIDGEFTYKLNPAVARVAKQQSA